MATNILFAGNSLQTDNILTAEIDHVSVPTKDVKMYALSHANRSKIPYTGYPSRTIHAIGKILPTIAGDIAGTDTLIDTFKSYFLLSEQNLDIDYAGSTRRYIATVNSLAINRPGNLAYANFNVEFICPYPFGMETSSTTAISATGRTLNAYTDTYIFGGTAPFQLPIFTYTLTAVTGGTTQYIQIGNGANGQAITITRTWTAGDILVVDCIQHIVTVNGTEVAFSGAFPEFPPGSQSLQVSDGFTTRTFNYGVTYTKAYL